MAALKTPCAAFGSVHKPCTRCCQPRCLPWLTLGAGVTLVVSGDPRGIAAFSVVCRIASELRVGGKDSNISILMAQKTIS